MRVLHVIPSLGPVYGGPVRVVPELARALAKEGIITHIATTNANGKAFLDVPLGIPQDDHGVSVYYFSQQHPERYTFSWPLTSWLWQHLKKYDLVHISALFSYPTFAASRIASRQRRPYVVCPHGMLEPWSLKYKAWKKLPYLRLIDQTTLSRAAALHALSVNETFHFRALNLSVPTFVLPNGVSLDEFSSLPTREVFQHNYPQTKGKSIILFLGRIDPKKGLDLLVAAFAQVTRKNCNENVCLVIAGPDLVGYRSAIEELISKERIRERVLFTGELLGEAKLAAFSAADIFVLPSRSEGFSVAVLEALASGCPVIITEGCNFPKVSKIGAGQVIPLDIGHLQQAIMNLLNDRERRISMGVRGRELVQKEFSWQSIGSRMLEIYKDILNKERRSNAWIS